MLLRHHFCFLKHRLPCIPYNDFRFYFLYITPIIRRMFGEYRGSRVRSILLLILFLRQLLYPGKVFLGRFPRNRRANEGKSRTPIHLTSLVNNYEASSIVSLSIAIEQVILASHSAVALGLIFKSDYFCPFNFILSFPCFQFISSM